MVKTTVSYLPFRNKFDVRRRHAAVWDTGDLLFARGCATVTGENQLGPRFQGHTKIRKI